MSAEFMPCTVAMLANAGPQLLYLRDEFVFVKQGEVVVHGKPPSSRLEEASKTFSRLLRHFFCKEVAGIKPLTADVHGPLLPNAERSRLLLIPSSKWSFSSPCQNSDFRSLQ
jgi:hypothetical protein